MLRRFNEILKITDTINKEKHRFVHRINQTVFKHMENYVDYQYKKTFEGICYLLGENADDRISDANRNPYASSVYIPRLRSLTNDDFQETLKITYLLYEISSERDKAIIDEEIRFALSHATMDLGIRWQDGIFYPSGAEELDKALVEEPLLWLKNFPAEKTDFLKAIEKYMSKEYGEVIMNCYLTVEGLSRQVLSNRKTLENNIVELLTKLNLSQDWKSILRSFINYANETKRHASDKRHAINPQEAEAFLYMTGLLVRLTVKTL